MTPDKIIHVSCAIIEKSGLVLAAQRDHEANNAGKWEFPGGKIEPEETAKDCIIREIREELSVEIIIYHELPSVRHQYPDMIIVLHPFVCMGNEQKIKLTGHNAIKWVSPGDLHLLDWSEADIKVWQYYKDQYLPEKEQRGIE
jgi:8-oxo-dGTP diphosphatase